VKRALLALALASTLTACAKRPPPGPPPPRATDPAELLALAQGDPWPGPLVGSFTGTVRTPDRALPVRGDLLVGAPGQLRLELRGPIGGPAALLTADGTTLSAWLASENLTWRVQDADGLLRLTLDDPKAGLATLTALLLGRAPASERAPSASVEDGATVWTWEGPMGKLRMGLDPASARVARASLLGRDGAALLSVRNQAGGPPAWLPAELDLDVPAIPMNGTSQGPWTIRLRLEEWSPAQPAPEAFRWTPPAGGQVREIGVR
jgi:hypothetical protein